ncbi:GNAT family N-acetyltransferase [Arthrobacter cheniae]|uniref:GNAT family N-acetyltransferase n=1 Tax=Arthrobacter cheniae TaxID=1258888 RepID=A0A3A5M244_9MICC|nr:GNAT family N-acetyltransferase [Arthrobacter cheniae]RJT79165.1 GNAT family N-acetyltransferase [Arthrobacter cheniae]
MTSRIRLVASGDDEALTELQVRNRDFLAPWDPVRNDDYFTVSGQRADIEGALARHERGEAMPWVILTDDGEIAGRLTLSGIVRGPFQSCSMGYWLAEDQTGKGLATEAVRAAVIFAFTKLELHRVQAETLIENVASRSVLAKTGFEQYGLAPRYLKIAGSWKDHLVFQRLNDSVR